MPLLRFGIWCVSVAASELDKMMEVVIGVLPFELTLTMPPRPLIWLVVVPKLITFPKDDAKLVP